MPRRNMKDQQHITIKIANQPPIGLDIPRDREEEAHRVERSVNKVWARWCQDFHDRKPEEVLAMVAYQYAKLYYELQEQVDGSLEGLADFEQQLDKLLLDVG